MHMMYKYESMCHESQSETDRGDSLSVTQELHLVLGYASFILVIVHLVSQFLHMHCVL